MIKDTIYLFGYGAIGKQIASKIHETFDVVVIDTDQMKIQHAKEDGFLNAKQVDITSDNELLKLDISASSQVHVVCAMDKEQNNIFLVISLRALYKSLKIIAISNSLEMNHKLLIAGATKVLDIYKPSANRIFNILQKPYVLKVFDILFNPASQISFKQFVVPSNSEYIDKKLDTLNIKKYGLILIGVMDSQMDEYFTFTTHGHKHIIKEADILVCMGKDSDLKKFKKHFYNL